MIQGLIRKRYITTWLLPVVLVLSLFTFSGTNSLSTVRQCKVTTEQVDLLRIRKATSVKIFGTPESPGCLNRNRLENLQRIVFHHNHSVTIQSEQCTKQCLKFSLLHRLLPLSPRFVDEDSVIPKLG